MKTRKTQPRRSQQRMVSRYLSHILKAREAANELASMTACYHAEFPDWKRCGDLERATELCYTMACGIQTYPANDQAQAQPPTATPERK